MSRCNELKRDFSQELSNITSEFFSLMNLEEVELSSEMLTACESFISKLNGFKKNVPHKVALIRSIKKKLKLEEKNYKHIIDTCAKHRLFFNTLDKRRLYEYLIDGDLGRVRSFLRLKDVGDSFYELNFSNLKIISEQETLELLLKQVKEPINRRTKQIDLSLKKTMLGSIFSSYLYEIYDEKQIHCLNSGINQSDYEEDYWKFIHSSTGGLYDRKNALIFVSLECEEFQNLQYDELRNKLVSYVAEAFNTLDNHSHFFIYIPRSEPRKWELAADITLFSEKFIEAPEKIGYFKPDKIFKETIKNINCDVKKELFDKVNEGFFYKDCFCVFSDNSEDTTPSLLLAFRKDVRDEQKLPCPKCRSLTVQGNSYPKLGVKSWECKNMICSDRSMSSRGKRFSFESLLRQQSIDCPDAQISKTLISKWKRDILYDVSSTDVFEYVIRCYSLPKDGVQFIGVSPDQSYGRTLSVSEALNFEDRDYWEEFIDSDFFRRWLLLSENANTNAVKTQNESVELDSLTILKGDSEVSLTSIASNTVDGAVTSPPYYNAREYSQYANIYCYIHKMLNIAKQVHRTLKPGGVFLYNIFDYFDNENIVTQSAMGKKRLILSSYITYAFKDIGFELVTNIPWDKGEIEGNRAYNSGNQTPFYQSPLNCWEHILVFKKSGESNLKWPTVFKCKPVFKIVKGENKYGHTAPYPVDLPNLLTSQLSVGKSVLDPFAGSGTTAVSAKTHSLNSIMCEASDEYIDLIISKFMDANVL